MTLHAPARWRPARAGILNVYQYEDETLHFADGRLLLFMAHGALKTWQDGELTTILEEIPDERNSRRGGGRCRS